ncbi:MAG: glycosyltransferase family 4 protein, partial [Actinomycetota bacterium]
MNIAIVAPSPVPHAIGGAERLWAGLLREINETSSHDAELIKLPNREGTLPDLVASYENFSRLDLSHFDMVISTKYPAWMVRHPHHIV